MVAPDVTLIGMVDIRVEPAGFAVAALSRQASKLTKNLLAPSARTPGQQ